MADGSRRGENCATASRAHGHVAPSDESGGSKAVRGDVGVSLEPWALIASALCVRWERQREMRYHGAWYARSANHGSWSCCGMCMRGWRVTVYAHVERVLVCLDARVSSDRTDTAVLHSESHSRQNIIPYFKTRIMIEPDRPEAVRWCVRSAAAGRHHGVLACAAE